MRENGGARFSRGWSPIQAAWAARSREIGAALLVIVALVAVLPRLAGAVHWTPDGLFYQAHVYEIQGESQSAALHREFSSPAAIAITRPDGRLGNPKWVNYSAQFYRRRWVVPLLAAAIYPAAGDRSLLYVSIAGYVATGLLLFWLLRRRFSDGVSLIASLACMLLPPTREFGGYPLTDSWGVALEIAALLVGLLALERADRWLVVWVLTMIALAFTRDSTVVVLAAVGWVALMTRTRRSVVVLATGVAASLPAFVLFGAPVVRQLAYVLQGFHPPTNATWSYVIAHYPAALWSVLRQDAHYPLGLSFPAFWIVVAAVLIAAVVYMLIASPHRDPFFMLMRGAFVGAAALIAAAVNYTGLRLELVFLPCVAAALAFAVARVSTPVRAWLSRHLEAGTPVLEPDG